MFNFWSSLPIKLISLCRLSPLWWLFALLCKLCSFRVHPFVGSQAYFLYCWGVCFRNSLYIPRSPSICLYLPPAVSGVRILRLFMYFQLIFLRWKISMCFHSSTCDFPSTGVVSSHMLAFCLFFEFMYVYWIFIIPPLPLLPLTPTAPPLQLLLKFMIFFLYYCYIYVHILIYKYNPWVHSVFKCMCF